MRNRNIRKIILEKNFLVFGNLNFKKKLIVILITTYFFIVCSYSLSAVNIGVSPASISFRQVLRGGYAEKTIIISSDSIEPIDIEIKPRGDILDWLEFSNKSFKVSRGRPFSLKISIKPPKDMPNGEYTGFLRIMSSSLGKDSSGNSAVGLIRSSLDLFMTAEIVDTEVLECSASNFLVNSVEKGEDLVFKIKISNDGNIRIKPRVKIDIWDRDQTGILVSKEFFSDEVLPTVERETSFKIKTDDFDVGQYWADVSVLDCYSNQLLTFDVLEPGSLRAEGVLLNLVSPKQIFLGDTVLIKAGFKNIGEKSVSAQFDGRASLNGKIVDLIRSDKFDVPVSGINDFNLYFTPKQTGKYIISGRVLYSGKKTYELSTTLEVLSKKLEYKSFLIFLIYVILIFLIFILFYKIRKEKRTYIKKIRRIK